MVPFFCAAARTVFFPLHRPPHGLFDRAVQPLHHPAHSAARLLRGGMRMGQRLLLCKHAARDRFGFRLLQRALST